MHILTKIKYFDWLYQLDYDKVPYDNLFSLLGTTIELVNNLYDGKLG